MNPWWIVTPHTVSVSWLMCMCLTLPYSIPSLSMTFFPVKESAVANLVGIPSSFTDMVSNEQICLSYQISEISCNGVKLLDRKKSHMEIKENLFRPILTTKGRKTGKQHSVMLRAVNYNGKIYFSRHKPDGDWFKNALANPEVKIEYNNFIFLGKAKLVTDEELSKKISQLKYPGEERAKESRVTIEVTLDSV